MKTSELTGPALDWAVAITLKGNVRYETGIFLNQGDGYEYFTPSTDWSQGGPIIEREKISVLEAGKFWGARPLQDGVTTIKDSYGPTPLIAAMRCYVASKLGDTVDIPDELL